MYSTLVPVVVNARGNVGVRRRGSVGQVEARVMRTSVGPEAERGEPTLGICPMCGGGGHVE